MICTPNGELHSLGSKVIKSFLISKGFKVFNISPSVEGESVTSYIQEIKPDVVFISISLDENIKAGKNLEYRFLIMGGKEILPKTCNNASYKPYYGPNDDCICDITRYVLMLVTQGYGPGVSHNITLQSHKRIIERENVPLVPVVPRTKTLVPSSIRTERPSRNHLLFRHPSKLCNSIIQYTY